MIIRKRKCPVCNKIYTQPSAISRKNKDLEICPDCGLDEAPDDFFESGGNLIDQKRIREEIHSIVRKAGAMHG